MVTASLQVFFKSAGHKLRDDYIVHFNCAKLVLSKSKRDILQELLGIISTKATYRLSHY